MAEAATAAATEVLDQDGDGKLTIDDAKVVASKAKEQILAAYEKAKSGGFFGLFTEYNQEIIKPLKEVESMDLNAFKTETLATLQLAPTSPRNGFVFFNVAALLFGILETLIGFLLGDGWISLIWNGFFGYAIAYTLYWVMTASNDHKLMRYGLGFLVLYVAFSVYMAITKIIWVIPAVLYGAKALVNLLQLINGYALFKLVKPDVSVFSMV